MLQSRHLFNVATFSLNHHLKTDLELGGCLFHGGSSANTRRMAAIRLALVLWEVMLVMFSTYDQTKQSSMFRSGEQGASERRVQSRSTSSEAKPVSLWTCGPAPSPAATPRVNHRPSDCTKGSPHSSAHPGTLWC